MVYDGAFELEKSILTPCEECKMKHIKLLGLVITQQHE